MIRRAAAALAMAILLAGCAHVGPHYDGPDSALAKSAATAAPFVSAAKGPFRDEPMPDRWWQLYEDPLLDRLIAEALTANTDLRVATANLERAEAATREAGGQGGLQTGLSGTAAFAKPQGSTAPGQLAYGAGISVSYELDLFGRLHDLVEAAQADAGAAQAARDLVRINVAAGVASAYADACSAAYQRAAVQRSLDLQLQSLAATDRLIAAGRGNALDHARGQVLVEQLRAQLPGFDAAHENALFRLATLTGRPPAEFPAEAATCATPPRLAGILPVGDGAALIRRRPDIRAAERNLAAATARTGQAVTELYPTIRLGAGLSSGGPVASLGSSAGFAFSLGPLISWTFPNRTIAHAHIDEAEATQRAALARFDGTVLGALREVETALTSYAHELQRNGTLHAATTAARQATAQTHRLRLAGRESALAEIDAERTEAAAMAAEAASDAALASDQIQLFLALGGGWQDAGG